MSGGGDDLKARVESLEERVAEVERRLESGAGETADPGLRGFVNDIDSDTHTERALAIGFYLDRYRGMENFTKDDIDNGYRDCRVQQPANLSDTLAKAEKKGWLMRDGTDGNLQLWRVTGDGIEHIDDAIKNNGS